MKVINARNVHEALFKGMMLINEHSNPSESRAGDVLVIDGPVTTEYRFPDERVLFYPERDANPFFHFMEGLWMLGGRNDVSWISQFSSNIAQFSDDGKTFHGAYGHRWRNHFVVEGSVTHIDGISGSNIIYTPFDQLRTVAEMLKQNPQERRCVVAMWDAESDLGRLGKDIPCNLLALFSISQTGDLNMTVYNRSNDMIWGTYGANAVHFSMLQEVMAAWVGVPVGKYWQVSNNYHVYNNVYQKHIEILNSDQTCAYENREVAPFKMVNIPIDTWFGELNMFLEEGPVMGFTDPFFRKVAAPLWDAWFAFKNKEDPQRIERALIAANRCAASDWRKAAVEWLQRRNKK